VTGSVGRILVDAGCAGRDLFQRAAVGLNLEDITGSDESSQVDLPLQVEKIRAIRKAGEALGVPVVLNARTDIYLMPIGPEETRFERTVQRLRAYREAGADCLFVPGLKDADTIAKLVRAVIQVESHPYLPETELLDYCKGNGIVFLAFAPLGHGMKPGLLQDPVITGIAARVGKTPAQVLLAWALQRGTALLTTPKSAERARENFDVSELPQDAMDEINGIKTRQRLNEVVKTGVPGFIPQGS